MIEIRKLTGSLNLGGDAVGQLGKFGLAMNGAKQAMQLLVGAFNVAKDVLFDFTTEMAAQGDEIAKAARNTGITAEAFQELGHAAEIAGSSGAAVTKSIQRLSKNISDARIKGVGPFVDQLKDLNIGIEEFDGLSPDEAFAKVADITKDIVDPMEKMAFAQDALGRGGKELIPLLNEGAEGIANYREEAQELGLFTNQQAALSEELVDAQTRLNTTLNDIKITIAAELMPVTMELIDGVREWIGENKELLKQKLREFLTKASEAARQLKPALLAVGDALATLIPLVAETLGEFGLLWKQLNDLQDDMDNGYAPGWKAFADVINATLTPVQLLGNAFSWVADNLEKVLRFAGPVGIFLSKFVDDVNDLPVATTRGLGAGAVQTRAGPGGGGAAATTQAAQTRNVRDKMVADTNTAEGLLAIATNTNLDLKTRKKAAEKNRQLVRAGEGLEILANFGATVRGVRADIAGRRTKTETKSGKVREKPKRRSGGGGKKEEKLTDEELLALINQAAQSGESLTGLIGDRKVPDSVPPVITVTIDKKDFHFDIDAPIEVNGVPGQSAVEIAIEARAQFEDMLSDSLESALTRQAPAQGI